MEELNKSFDEFMAEDDVKTYATQRVKLTDDQRSASPRRRTPRASANPHSAAQQPVRRKKQAMTKKERNTVIALFSVAGALLIGIIIALSFILSGPADNELILNNVYVAGVNIGGMTKAQAKSALSEVAKNFEQLDMVVKVLDTEEKLTPQATGAKLDVNAVVNAAYDLGRTGSKSEQDKAQNAASHNVSILPYLHLNTEYIDSVTKSIGKKYNTLRSDPVIKVEGQSPLDSSVDPTDTETQYQTMTIFMGTAEYDFSSEALYQQIMDAYDSGIFQVVGQCTVTPPNLSVLDVLDKAFKQYCRTPVDADIDEDFNVTAEVYGYGFVLEEVKDLVSAAKYGQTLTIPMTFVRPDITAEDLAGNLFKDILGAYVLDVEADNNLISNLKQVCKALNGLILKSDESFSFNELIGEPTRQRGYKPFSQFVGKVYTENYYGGGLSQAASALYTCVLLADLDVLERHSHAYVPTFILPGMDADILYGSKDLRFKNSTENPIRIIAEYKNGQLHIQLLGTDTKDYTVELKFTTDKVYDPVTLLQTMPANNAGGYKNGDILQTPIVGYDISVYKVCTPKPPVVEDGEEGDPTDPSEPSEPTEPSEPSEPTEPSEPSETIDPSNPSDPLDPSNPEDPSETDAIEVFVGQSHYDKRNVVIISIDTSTEAPTEPSEPIPSETVNPTEG